MSAVAAAFIAACDAELRALKPGNVHDHAAGHGMTVADFRRSADAAAPAIADASLAVGARIQAAARATRTAVGQNTNLGILLLCAPLALAAERIAAAPTPALPQPSTKGGCDAAEPPSSPGVRRGRVGVGAAALRSATRKVLQGLTVADASSAFAAIRLASPGGLGRAGEADVAAEPEVTLLEAMRLAQTRDRIAWNYAHDFGDVFGSLLPRLLALRARGWPEPWAVSGTFMALLAAIPDSHVARKYGAAAAVALRTRARPLAQALLAAEDPASLTGRLLALDAALKAQGLNPGTTADLVVACGFAARLSGHAA